MHRWMSMLNNIGLPQSFHLTYIVEILILTVIIYELLIWVKTVSYTHLTLPTRWSV